MSTLSTHILDISTGRPAQGVRVVLEREGALIASGITDDNGRIGELRAGSLTTGRYRLTAEIGEWFAASGRDTSQPCDPRINRIPPIRARHSPTSRRYFFHRPGSSGRTTVHRYLCNVRCVTAVEA